MAIHLLIHLYPTLGIFNSHQEEKLARKEQESADGINFKEAEYIQQQLVG
jgi:hypothetical protein